MALPKQSKDVTLKPFEARRRVVEYCDKRRKNGKTCDGCKHYRNLCCSQEYVFNVWLEQIGGREALRADQ